MGVTQSGVYSNSWVVDDGNPPDKAAHLPPISGRGRPQTLFSAVKEQDPSAKVNRLIEGSYQERTATRGAVATLFQL